MSVTDSLREAFGVLREIKETLGRIDERTERTDDCVQDHEKRIQSLELKEAKRSGVIATIGSIAGAAGAGVMWLFKHIVGAN